MCQSADMLYFEHHYKFRTIIYSLEPKNHTKLWVHGNRGRMETGDTTVGLLVDLFSIQLILVFYLLLRRNIGI